jgi:putative ABC transport system permease protein
MMFQLGFRNVFRHRGRFFLGTFIVAIASLLLVYATGQIGGVNQALVRGVTDTLTGQAQIKLKAAPRDFFEYPSARHLAAIEPAALERLLAKVRALDIVAAASPRMRFGALIGDQQRSTPALVIGVDPATEGAVTPDLGTILAPLSSSTAALVSEYLVRKSGIPVGGELLVFADTPLDSFSARPYTIAGHAKSPVLIDEFMNGVVLVNLASARKLLYVDASATEIAIRFKPGQERDLAAAVAKVEALLDPDERNYLGVYPYTEVAKSVKNIGTIATSMGSIQVGAVMFVMLVIVLMITKMGLYERRAEIGTLMSIGMTRTRLMGLFVVEIVIKMVIGYGVGFAIAILLLLGVRHQGGIRSATAIEQYMYGGKIMMPVIDLENMAIGFVLVLAAALLTTLVSCWKAGNEDVVVLLNSHK